ncbi:MAG TPA: DUF58 domain-containing protein [Gemmataceae bacterium]|jgi:uncharacterized protein (DUF58 family)
MPETAVNYLDPLTLAQVGGLELQARLVVEGYLAGLHRSPHHGFAVEFAQHREYSPGDDVKHIDWKVFGRTERFYLKQYEQETNLVCWLLVDASQSMAYGSGPVRKYDYACMAAASLAYLIVRQADSVGLAVFDAQVRRFIRAAGHAPQLKEVVRALGDGPSTAPTKLGPVLHEIAGRARQRGLVMLFSDLFDDVPAILSGLQHLRYDRHEVVVFHVLDPAEEDFPFDGATKFRGLEIPAELLTDPRGLRDGYLRELNAFRDDLRRGCRGMNIDLVPLRTDQSLGLALARYLAHRMR